MLEINNKKGTVAKIIYDDTTGILVVVFRGKKGDTEYEYTGVPMSKITDMEESSTRPGFSYGKWISKNIVRGGYKYEKLS